MEAIYGLFFLLSGLGVLLYGIQGVGQGLESVAGKAIRRNISKLSKNRFVDVLSGLGSTIMVQSSSVSTIMYIGLINIGALTLLQALPIFLGAQVGSSLVLFLLCFESFNIVEIFGLFALIGALMFTFSKNPQVIKIGKTITSFGLLFCGLKMTSIGMEAVTNDPNVSAFIASLTNPFLLILIGIICGMGLHCLGTTALIVSLMSLSDSTMTMMSAMYLIAGANTGTTFASVLACLKSNITAKRATIFNVYMSVGTTIIMVLVVTFTPLVEWVSSWISNESVVIVLILAVMNILNAILQLFLVKPISKLLYKILPDKNGSERQKIFILESNLTSNLPIASHQILKGMQELALEQREIIDKVEAYLKEPSKRKKQNLVNRINVFYTNIAQTKSNILKVSDDSNYMPMLQYYSSALGESEHIAELCLNIINRAVTLYDLTETEKDCIKEHFDLIQKISKAYEVIFEIKEKELLDNIDIEIEDEFSYDKELAFLKIRTRKLLYKRLESQAKTVKDKKLKLQKFDEVFTIIQALENIVNYINNQIVKIC